MATISAEAVKDLRERTGAGFMDCKRALEETGGDEVAAEPANWDCRLRIARRKVRFPASRAF